MMWNCLDVYGGPKIEDAIKSGYQGKSGTGVWWENVTGSFCFILSRVLDLAIPKY